MMDVYSEEYRNYENTHWWFKARREIIANLLQKYCVFRNAANVLEIGVGPGQNLVELYPSDIEVFGLEPDTDNAKIALERSGVHVECGRLEDIGTLYPECKFDVITMFDVLEHILDDANALQILSNATNESGYVVLTVPAYQFLWSDQDRVNLHYRRYTKNDLIKKINSTQFEIICTTYFNTLLFPLIACFRLCQNCFKRREIPHSDFEYTNLFMNKLFFHIFRAERNILTHVNFPFGLSLFMVLKKK